MKLNLKLWVTGKVSARAKNRALVPSLLSALVLLWISCTSLESAIAAATKTPLKVGFITVGPVTDWGWNYAHNEGRLYLEKNLPQQVQTTVVEKIPESAEVERVMEKLIAQGNRLIFSTSYGYLEPALRVAKRHSDVVIMQAARPATANNLGSYVGSLYEAMYVSGIVAGRMTKKNNVGFVAAHPVPIILQYINAFTLGAHSVNPKVTVHVTWTNSWSDPPTEAEAAKGLIEAGADVIGVVQDSPTAVVQTAEKEGAYSIGNHADLNKFAPKGWLTGGKWNWGPYYVKVANSVIANTWKPASDSLGMKDGAIELSSFGPSVPKSVQQEATAARKKIVQGELIIFKGPLKDRDGKTRLNEGQKADLKCLSEMDWFVPGVEGALPKK
jgi:basic membrane protein A